MNSSGGWILEVDIRKFFDTLCHAHLREFLQLRVRDGVLKRLIGKWLKAGVMEEGNVSPVQPALQFLLASIGPSASGPVNRICQFFPAGLNSHAKGFQVVTEEDEDVESVMPP